MSDWDRKRSEERIRKLLATVPRPSSIRTFDAAEFTRRQIEMRTRAAAGFQEGPIFNVPPGVAVRVDGVHVYVQLVDFSMLMLDVKMETEAGHARLLTMLHLHYAACDSVAMEFEAQRVDYHGPRMHAVIVTPPGPENERERVRRALEFADAVTRTIRDIGRSVASGLYESQVRIGIDSGWAVAINSGRGSEPEPLFLGSPANHAAKLAEGDQPGIYVSAGVRRQLGIPFVGSLREERAYAFSPPGATRFGGRAATADPTLVQRAVQRVRAGAIPGGNLPTFQFHNHEPPLRTIDFVEISASNAIRMELISIFGDVSGFTANVDACIAEGRIADMVQNFHVIRGELAACLRDDFGGRKIRFIGDCIHGVIAEGDSRSTDAGRSVASAVAAAAGLRSSFELCQRLLHGLHTLGIAMGLELGTTPIARIGIRGDRSVRCCTSKAVSTSEILQSGCEGNETRIGDRAYLKAPASVQRIFGSAQTAFGLDYAAFRSQTSAPAVVKSGSVAREARPYAG